MLARNLEKLLLGRVQLTFFTFDLIKLVVNIKHTLIKNNASPLRDKCKIQKYYDSSKPYQNFY